MITVDGLTFVYHAAGEPVLKGLSADFPSGALTAVTGPSGTGKSTLLYLVGLMLRPTSGVVRWDGRAVSGLGDAERSQLRAGRTGFVFQDAVLDPSRTVLDNVLEAALYAGMERSAARSYATRLLERFGVDTRAAHRPGERSRVDKPSELRCAGRS